MTALEKRLVELLELALASMKQENDNRERDVHDIGCGNCVAGVPMAHSLGCRIESAIRDARRK